MPLRFQIAFVFLVLAGFTAGSAFTPARAQSLEGLFGGIVGAAVEEQNRAEWMRVPREERACIGLGLRKEGADLPQIIRAGIPPTDGRIASIRSTCLSVTDRKLRRNVDCTINTGSGAFTSKCDEDFVSGADSKVRISQADALEQAFSEQGVSTAMFERPDAQNRREQMVSTGTTGGNVVVPNFDCAKARTETETAICNSAVLSALDAEYGRLYRRYNATGRQIPISKQVVWLQKRRDECGAAGDCIRGKIEASVDFMARLLRRRGETVETSVEHAHKVAALEAERVEAQKREDKRLARLAEEQAAERARQAEEQRRAEANRIESDRRATADRIEAQRKAAEARAKAEAERIEVERKAAEARAKAAAERKAHLAKVTIETNDLVRLASDFLKSDKSNPRLLTIAEAIASATAALDTLDPDKIEQAKAELDRAVRDDPTFLRYQQAQAEAQSQENARLLADAHAQARKQARFLKSYIAENPTSAAAKGAIGFVKKADELSASTDLKQLRGYIGSVQDLLRQYDLQNNFLLSLNAIDDKTHNKGIPSNEVGLGRTAKNRFLVDGAGDDLVLMYVSAPSAPDVVRNLRGDIVFDHAKAVACLYEKDGPSLLRDRVTKALQEKYQIESLLIDVKACAPDTVLTNDVIAVKRGDFLKQEVAYASALIREIENDHVKPLLAISGDQISTTLQSVEAKRKRVEEDIEHGAFDGFGLVILPAYPSEKVCGAIKDGQDAHEAILDRFADPTVARLRQHLDLQSDSFEGVFRDVQRSRCSAVYAAAADLKLLLDALRRDRIAYQIFEETISSDQVKKEQERISAASAADEKAALDRQKQAEDARTLRAVRERDLASTKQAQQAALREKFGKLATSSAAEISNDVKAFFQAEGAPKTDEAGADVPTAYPYIANWFQNALREHWQLQSVDAALDDYGSVDWKGRALEAAVAVIHVRLRNAIVGEYRDGCFKAAHVIDHEFKATRDAVGLPCDNIDALSSWKLAHTFKSSWTID